MDTNQDWRAQRRQEQWQRHQERWQRRQERWERRGYGAHAHHPWAGALIGVLMILGGGLFLLHNLGISYLDNLSQYWPVILIVLGISHLLRSRRHFPFGGLVLVGLGSIFLLRNLGIVTGSIWSYVWPVAAIAFGISMLMRSIYGPHWWGGQPPSPESAATSQSDENVIHIDTIFGAIDRKFQTQEFEGGTISASFAGVKVDLRNAAMQKPEVVLTADAMFGGIEIIVPAAWRVEVRGTGTFGGYEDHTHPQTAAGAAPKLVVNGSAVFGGVMVRN